MYVLVAEVIQETSYDGRADVWSLGITAIELCEGQPPHYNVHPMRAIFMIPMKPAPTLKDPAMWSAEMLDFLGCCLVKKMEDRATTEHLLDHRWILEDVHRIRQGRSVPALSQLVADNMELIKRMRVGDEVPAVEDAKKTIDRAGGGGTMKRTARPSDTFNVINRQTGGRGASMRRVAKETVGKPGQSNLLPLPLLAPAADPSASQAIAQAPPPPRDAQARRHRGPGDGRRRQQCTGVRGKGCTGRGIRWTCCRRGLRGELPECLRPGRQWHHAAAPPPVPATGLQR